MYYTHSLPNLQPSEFPQSSRCVWKLCLSISLRASSNLPLTCYNGYNPTYTCHGGSWLQHQWNWHSAVVL